jgi:hypothetical protein
MTAGERAAIQASRDEGLIEDRDVFTLARDAIQRLLKGDTP